MKIELDVPYAKSSSDIRLLDLYIPERESSNHAAILWIHGGAWYKGDKAQFRTVAEWFCHRGYCCASMRYHLSQERTYPAAIEDARLAMQFMRTQARNLGYEEDRIAAAGSSAGGYLAAMLALIDLQDELARTSELTRRDTKPNAVVLFCPVTHVHDKRSFKRQFMGVDEQDNPELYLGASPIDRIKGGEPPFLIMQGDADTLTPLNEIIEFQEQLRNVGSHVELLVHRGVGHGFGYGTQSEAQLLSCETAHRYLQGVIANLARKKYGGNNDETGSVYRH